MLWGTYTIIYTKYIAILVVIRESPCIIYYTFLSCYWQLTDTHIIKFTCLCSAHILNIIRLLRCIHCTAKIRYTLTFFTKNQVFLTLNHPSFWNGNWKTIIHNLTRYSTLLVETISTISYRSYCTDYL